MRTKTKKRTKPASLFFEVLILFVGFYVGLGIANLTSSLPSQCEYQQVEK